MPASRDPPLRLRPPGAVAAAEVGEEGGGEPAAAVSPSGPEVPAAEATPEAAAVTVAAMLPPVAQRRGCGSMPRSLL